MPNLKKNQRTDVSTVQMILQQLKLASKRKNGSIRLGKPRRPKSIKPLERRYFKELMRMMNFAEQITLSELDKVLESILTTARFSRPQTDSARKDEWPTDVAMVIQSIKTIFSNSYDDKTYESMAQYQGDAINDYNLGNFKTTFKSVLGLDYYALEPWVRFEVESFTNINVSYIKSIPTQYFDKVQQIVTNGVTQGKLTRDIKADLKTAFGLSENKAALIAVDQTNKFNGELNKVRQTGVGIGSYIWRGVLDARERPEHVAREGQKFTWASPPWDGAPGQPVRCRCYAEPVFDPSLFE